jgi:SNF2 family DNA or RNA helicase
MNYIPKQYMEKAIEWLLKHPESALFLDPGLGKTGIVFAALMILRNLGVVKRTLVIAPLRVAHLVWPKECQKWDQFRGFKVSVLHGPRKLQLLNEPHDITVINPEGVPWLFKAMIGKGWWWDMLVIDESTQYKHTNTARFKTLKPNLRRFKRRTILTGSPAPNGLMDLFGQVYIADMGRSLGQFITRFRETFFTPGNSQGHIVYDWRPKLGAQQAIYERLSNLALRMDAKDHLNLEPYISNVIDIELPTEARVRYTEMENYLVTQIKDNTVTAANSAVATMKCRQLANGGIYTNPDILEFPGAGRTSVHVHDAKTEALQDIVEELGGKPVLVAYEFGHDLERLRKAFPEARWLGGGVSAKAAQEIEADWNAGRLHMLLAQPQSAGLGLNLQGVGSAVVWYSIPWDLLLYEQLIRRVWRQGQTERVVVHHLRARNTVDEVVFKALMKKDRTQQDLLNGLKEYAARRTA